MSSHQFDLNDDLGFDNILNPSLKKKDSLSGKQTETKSTGQNGSTTGKQEEKKSNKGGSNLILYVVIILLIVCVVSLIIWIFKRRKDVDEVAEQAIKEKDEEISKLKEQEKLLTKANSSYKNENQHLKTQIAELKHQSTLYEEKTKELTDLYNKTLKDTKEMNEKETFSRIKSRRQQVAASDDDSTESETEDEKKTTKKTKQEVKPAKVETETTNKSESKIKQKSQKKSHQLNPLIDNGEETDSDNEDQQTITDINGILN